MLKHLFENKSEKVATEAEEPTLSRADLERSRELQLSVLATETDPERLAQGVKRLAGLNQSIQKYDDLDRARREAQVARRRMVIEQREKARVDMAAFEQNCLLIATMVFDKHGISEQRLCDDDERPGLQMRVKEYYDRLFKDLKVDEAHQQADEILTASVRRRPWEAVVKLPAPSIRIPGRGRVNSFGEHI